ncbi:MAG TPA: metallophosphatase [Bacteroidales bacterium]
MKLRNILSALLLLTVVLVSARTPLVIIHTNDTHSQLEPFAEGEGYDAGNGGILRRECLIREVRSQGPNVLVFESGDFVQGTPYFNLFKGDAEMELMNFLKLDAVTLGNHEFDNGIEALATMLKKAEFPVVCTNYDVSQTVLKGIVKPWLIVKRGKLLIGIVGAAINLKGLTMSSNYEGLVYLDPISTVDARAEWLKKKKKCDIVICLSHLGYQYDTKKPDDLKLAEKSKNIDVILGGHTHLYLKEPTLIQNLNGDTVIVNQMGKSGVYMGRLDLSVGR